MEDLNLDEKSTMKWREKKGERATHGYIYIVLKTQTRNILYIYIDRVCVFPLSFAAAAISLYISYTYIYSGEGIAWLENFIGSRFIDLEKSSLKGLSAFLSVSVLTELGRERERESLEWEALSLSLSNVYSWEKRLFLRSYLRWLWWIYLKKAHGRRCSVWSYSARSTWKPIHRVLYWNNFF